MAKVEERSDEIPQGGGKTIKDTPRLQDRRTVRQQDN
jgi:hypothetical protein